MQQASPPCHIDIVHSSGGILERPACSRQGEIFPWPFIYHANLLVFLTFAGAALVENFDLILSHSYIRFRAYKSRQQSFHQCISFLILMLIHFGQHSCFRAFDVGFSPCIDLKQTVL